MAAIGCRRFILRGNALGVADDIAFPCPDFKIGHLAVVKAHDREGDDKNKGHQRVEIEGNGPYKKLQPGIGCAVDAA